MLTWRWKNSLESAQSLKKNSKMQEEINWIAGEVTLVLKDDILDLIKNNWEALSPFMKLFWKEQKKYLSINPKARKYHPMIIRICLSLAAKSPSAYDKLRKSNIYMLRSREQRNTYISYWWTLKNFITIKRLSEMCSFIFWWD